MRRSCSVIAAILLSAIFSAQEMSLANAAEAPANFAHREPHLAAQLVLDRAALVAGDTFQIGVELELDPGWHIYWTNPGDSGAPTQVAWSAPSEVQIDPVAWPAPRRFELGDLTSFGYSGRILLVSEGKVSAAISGTKEITAHLGWILCNDECIPGKTTLSLAIHNGELPATAVAPSRFSGYAATLPSDGIVTATATSNAEELVVMFRGNKFLGMSPESAFFIPERSGYLKASGPQEAVIEDDGALSLRAPLAHKYKPHEGDTIPGVLLISDQTGVQYFFKTSLSVAAPTQTSAGRDGIFTSPLAFAVASAFLGGLLLNLMPCVFPVLSLKVIALVEHAHSKNARPHMLLFVCGVMVSFLGLAATLCVLRALGSEVGWGFQFQSPRFVAAMVLLTFLLGLNLTGLFEIGLNLQSKAGAIKISEGYGGSFFSGVLATTLATPCTAPFMGSAVAAAFTAPIVGALAIFTALGLGMSIPYLLFATWPRLIQLLPRPGAWMESFKQALAFPMFATSVWLLNVLGSQQGTEAMTNCAAGMMLLALGCWILGRWGAPHRVRQVRVIARALAAALLIASFASAIPHTVLAQEIFAGAASNSNLRWEPFSEARLSELRAQKRPVLVDFTASWCLVCTVNHHRIFQNEKIMELIDKRNITLLRADWSTQDDGITRTLRRLGKSGVPLVVLFDGHEKPSQFDSLINPEEFLAAINTMNRLKVG